MPVAAPADSTIGRRLVTLAAGIAIVGLGVAMTIEADLGVAPYDVLTTGLANSAGIPIAVAAVIVPAAFVATGIAVGGRVGPGTAIATVAVGPVIGVFLAVVPDVDALLWRTLLFGVGALVIAAGITAVVVAEVGPGPAELVMLALHDRGYALAAVRTATEVGTAALGWVLGGEIGVGTVVVALTIGPTLRTTLRLAGYRRDPGPAAEVAAAAA